MSRDTSTEMQRYTSFLLLFGVDASANLSCIFIHVFRHDTVHDNLSTPFFFFLSSLISAFCVMFFFFSSDSSTDYQFFVHHILWDNYTDVYTYSRNLNIQKFTEGEKYSKYNILIFKGCIKFLITCTNYFYNICTFLLYRKRKNRILASLL